MRRSVTLGLGCALLIGCAGGTSSGEAGTLVPITGVDGSGAERALLYYAGGAVSSDAGDPLASGLLARSAGGFAIDLAHLPPRIADQFRFAGEAVSWETELKPAFQRSYAAARALPVSLAALQQEVGVWAEDDPEWFVHDVDGVMTAARRRLFVPAQAAREAAMAMGEGRTASYPVGTAIVGEHWMDGRRVETTVKRRRGDGHWDFAVYDADGALTGGTTTPPRPLDAPSKCIGCHLGSKLHQPEKAFPAEAPAGPAGPRAIHVPDAWRTASDAAGLALRFQGHARRADGVLGLYGTLYAARALARARAGEGLAREDSALVQVLKREGPQTGSGR